MSQLHPTEEDEEFAAGHAEAGFKMRIRWVMTLRAALAPFAAGTATEADRERARRALDETKEWLGDWAGAKPPESPGVTVTGRVTHDLWAPNCLEMQQEGKQGPLCLGCDILRNALRSLKPSGK